MTPSDLRIIGEALYGPRWQTPLADDLGVASRTVRAWLSGDRTISAGVAADIRALAEQRADSIRAALSTR